MKDVRTTPSKKVCALRMEQRIALFAAKKIARTKQFKEAFASGTERLSPPVAAKWDAITMSGGEECALGMEQNRRTVAMMDAQTQRGRGESALCTGQSNTKRKNVTMKDATTSLRKEECAEGMEEKPLAAITNAPTKPKREESAAVTEQKHNQFYMPAVGEPRGSLPPKNTAVSSCLTKLPTN
jgi:hypothetical protein